MAQVTYAAFLTWLLSFAQQLPTVLSLLQEAADKLAEVATLVRGTLPEPIFELTDEDTELEGKLALAVAGPNGAFDGSRLRAAWKFLNESGLLPVIISLLTKAAS